MTVPIYPMSPKHRTRTALTLFAVFFFALTGNAVAATAGWTPSQAAGKVKATYSTVDRKAWDFMDAKLQKLLADGAPETDPQVVAIRKALVSISHQAKPTSVMCKGSGRAVAGRYSRFHCTATVQGVARIPPDYVLYTASVKLTVTVAGSRWRIVTGWH